MQNIKSILNSITQIKLRHVCAVLFLLCLLGGLSFYLTDGYIRIGDAKYEAFMFVVPRGIIIWLITALVDAIGSGCGIKKIISSTLSFFESKQIMWIALFGTSAVISTLTSRYRAVALTGNDGWYMGLYTILYMIALYFIAMEFFCNASVKCKRAVVAEVMIITSVVFILGILNRFSIYPLDLYGRQEDYISTLGNINWYCGYWCIWMGVGCGCFMYSSSSRNRVICGIYVELAAIAGICCGASSAYLALGAIMLSGFLIACMNTESLKRFIYLIMVIFSALPIIRFIGLFRVNRMWYDSSLLRAWSFSMMGVIIWVVVCVLCVIILRIISNAGNSFPDGLAIRGYVLGFLGGSFVALICIIVLNSVIKGGIWPFRGIGILTFTDDWGNRRGLIWKITVQLLGETPLMGNIFGAGCDCFCSYAYNVETIAIRMYREWGSLVLTNAHNEALTVLVNQGVFGLVTYIGIFFAHICQGFELIDTHEKNDCVQMGGAATVMAVSAYLVVGLVGFWHILATPFLFIILGALAGLIKRGTITIMN